jgi:hypothetical protein
VAVICFMLVWLTAPAMAQAGKRLILKDGTWQDIARYELSGNSVRYLSSDRGEWEEIPAAIVDWKATEQWNTAAEKEPSELRQLEAEEEADRLAEEAKTPTVAPGLKLPAAGGVFMLDEFSDRPSLNELTQNESEMNNDVGKHVWRLSVDRKATIRQHFKLTGTSARVHAHIPVPAIFVKIAADPDAKIAADERFRIVQLEPDNDSRVLARAEVSVLGKQNQTEKFVSAHIENFREGWLKVVPDEALTPGEYALVEMLNQKEFNSYVWDFGIDPSAPANPHSIEAPPAESTTLELGTRAR